MKIKLPNDIFFAEVERLIAEGREVHMKVRGTSMRPFLYDGDAVVLIPLDGSKLQAGAVVLFRYHDKHILHRLKERKGEKLIFQGDSVPTVEETHQGDVVAVVKEAVKQDGTIIPYGSRRWGIEYRRLLRRRKIRTFLSRVKRRIMRK